MPIYAHKVQMLDDIEARYPAAHCVVIDDKLRILTASKAGACDDGLGTLGPHAHDEQAIAANLTIEATEDLLDCPAVSLLVTTA